MGSRPSIQIQTPPFKQNEWKYYQSEHPSYPEEGMFRTLINKQTGQLIDQYNLSWSNEEEYEYYLKSFNWRHHQLNVANTRFMVLKSQQQFCGQTFVARVYIEHVFSRLSRIKDIPYPDNLFVLMQALQGYSKIYAHSKYFEVEEGQICVDYLGNVKVWVNADLAMNYPNVDSHGEERGLGQEDMVERLVEIVAENTDRDSEPDMSFMDYYLKKKGARGRNFQEARVMVLDYARIYNERIPEKFQSVFEGLDDEFTQGEENREYEEQKHILPLSYDSAHNHQQNHHFQQPQQYQPQTLPQPQQMLQSRPNRPNIVIPPPPVSVSQGVFSPQHQVQRVNHPSYFSQVGAHPEALSQQQAIYHIPHYQRVEYPIHTQPLPQLQQQHQIQMSQGRSPQNFNQADIPMPMKSQHRPVQSQPQHAPLPFSVPQPQAEVSAVTHSSPAHPMEHSRKMSRPNIIMESKHEQSELEASKQSERDDMSPTDIRLTFNKNQELNGSTRLKPSENNLVPASDHTGLLQTYYRDSEYGQPNIPQLLPQIIEHEYIQDRQSSNHQNRKTTHYRNNSIEDVSNMEVSQADDMVAKSLPISSGYPGNHSQKLAAFGQSDRSIHSNGKQFLVNSHSYGNNSVKLQENYHQEENLAQSEGQEHMGQTSNSKIVQSSKYYFSLEEQLEIDPDIAADMARYLR